MYAFTYKTSLRLIRRLGVGFEDHRCAPCFDTFSSCQRHNYTNYLLSNLTSIFLSYLLIHIYVHTASHARTHAHTHSPNNLTHCPVAACSSQNHLAMWCRSNRWLLLFLILNAIVFEITGLNMQSGTSPKPSRNLPETSPKKTSAEPPRNLPETFPKPPRNLPETFPKPPWSFPKAFRKLP